MEVVFKNKALERLALTDWSDPKLPLAVCTSLKQKVVILKAAPDERTLRNWKSFHYEKLKGKYAGLRSIRLNKQFRLIFELSDCDSGPKITIVDVEDYHY